MPGPILNAKCEVIPLPFRMTDSEFMATPETLSSEIGKRRIPDDRWSLWTGFGKQDLLPYFDRERMIHYDPANRQTWLAGRTDVMRHRKQFSRMINIGTFVKNTHDVGLWEWTGETIALGPGWESHVDDIYWAVARSLRRYFVDANLDGEKEQMVKMALEAMMRSHGRI
jgi:hypothetical protein